MLLSPQCTSQHCTTQTLNVINTGSGQAQTCSELDAVVVVHSLVAETKMELDLTRIERVPVRLAQLKVFCRGGGGKHHTVGGEELCTPGPFYFFSFGCQCFSSLTFSSRRNCLKSSHVSLNAELHTESIRCAILQFSILLHILSKELGFKRLVLGV